MIFLPRTEQHAFNEQIWNLAREVPKGKVATYGQLAQMLSPPQGFSPEDYKAFSPRWAGDAMAACPDDVPWHRIINSQGKISLKRDAQRQQRLLEDEGLEFVNDKIDLKRHQWRNKDQAEAPKQETLF